MDAVFMMGFDAWSDGQDERRYLDSCRSSRKYREGLWWVLAEGETLLSALTTYRLSESSAGIGSIATPPALRGRGHASRLIKGVISELEQAGHARTMFLFSDIEPSFYIPFGFIALAAEKQKKPGSVCMVRCSATDVSALTAPAYF